MWLIVTPSENPILLLVPVATAGDWVHDVSPFIITAEGAETQNRGRTGFKEKLEHLRHDVTQNIWTKGKFSSSSHRASVK